jgi:hypothetical protein
MAVSGQYRALATLTAGKKQETLCIGNWVGPGAGLENSGREKRFPFVAIRTADLPTSSLISVTTALSQFPAYHTEVSYGQKSVFRWPRLHSTTK